MEKFILDLDVRKEKYKISKESKKGDKVSCPSCGDDFEKGRSNQTFCTIKCKDKYWNHINKI